MQGINHKKIRSQSRLNIYSGFKIAGVVVLMFVLSSTLASIGSTVSYYNNIETSVGNKLQAGVVGFNIFSLGDILSSFSVARIASIEEQEGEEEYEEDNIGIEEFSITVGEGEDSLPVLYNVSGFLDIANPLGCENLNITVNFGEYNYDGLFNLFDSDDMSEMGEWHFVVSLPEDIAELPPFASCKGEIVFHAGLAGVDEELMHTFNDEKQYTFEVLNWEGQEILEKEVLAEEALLVEPPEVLEEVEEEKKKSGSGGGTEEVPEEMPESFEGTQDDSTPSEEENTEEIEEEIVEETPEEAEEEVSEETPTETEEIIEEIPEETGEEEVEEVSEETPVEEPTEEVETPVEEESEEETPTSPEPENP